MEDVAAKGRDRGRAGGGCADRTGFYRYRVRTHGLEQWDVLCNPLIAPEHFDGIYLEVDIKTFLSGNVGLTKAVMNVERVCLKRGRLNLTTTNIQNAPRCGVDVNAGKA